MDMTAIAHALQTKMGQRGIGCEVVPDEGGLRFKNLDSSNSRHNAWFQGIAAILNTLRIKHNIQFSDL